MDKRFVVDNSVVMAWCFEDEISPYAELILDSLENTTAIVPLIWPLEVGNVLLVAERKKTSERDCRQQVYWPSFRTAHHCGTRAFGKNDLGNFCIGTKTSAFNL